MNRGILTALVVLGLLAAESAAQAPAPARPRDIVRTADRKILSNITVISETPTEVHLDTTGNGKADKTLDQNDVTEIQYDQVPNAYRQAEALYRVSNYDKAIQMFRQATAGGGRRWVKDYSAYYLAMCLARKSESDPNQAPLAIRAFEDLLKNRNNRWRDDARYQLGNLQLVKGDRAGAKTAFETLASSAHKQEMKLTASVGLADILMADKKPAEALKRYDTVVEGARGKFPDLFITATVGKAQAQTALGLFANAKAFLEGILKTAKNKALLAKAHTALADCFYTEAGAVDPKEAPASYKAALNQYLWVVVVYNNEKAEFAKALYYAGQCWKKLGDEKKARELFKELQSKFGATRWAAMSRRG